MIEPITAATGFHVEVFQAGQWLVWTQDGFSPRSLRGVRPAVMGWKDASDLADSLRAEVDDVQVISNARW